MSWRDFLDLAQRPRYALMIAIALCLAPVMYAKGCYLHDDAATAPAARAEVKR